MTHLTIEYKFTRKHAYHINYSLAPRPSQLTKEVAKNFLFSLINDAGVNWMWWLIFSWVVGSYLCFLCQKLYYHFFSVWAFLSWLVAFAFQFFFWVIIDGLFSPPWIFSIDLSFYLPHPWFIIHALRSAYFPTLHVSLTNFDLALRVQGL